MHLFVRQILGRIVYDSGTTGVLMRVYVTVLGTPLNFYVEKNTENSFLHNKIWPLISLRFLARNSLVHRQYESRKRLSKYARTTL